MPRSIRALGGVVCAGIAYECREEIASSRSRRSGGDVPAPYVRRAHAARRAATFNITAAPGISPRNVAAERRMRWVADDTGLALREGDLFAWFCRCDRDRAQHIDDDSDCVLSNLGPFGRADFAEVIGQ